jgi:3',5'-cyclic AMP phosphodiesterase CpdA
MRKTAGVMTLLLALPGSLSSLAAGREAAAGAFAGFDELNDSNPMIAVIGDTQVTTPLEFWNEKNDVQTRVILAEIADRFPAAVINLGDLVAAGASAGNWRTFDDLHAPLMEERIPYFAVRGNHDYRGPDDVAMGHFGNRFPHLKDGSWYSFRFLYAGIILLDSNFRALGRLKADEQTRWFERTLAEMDVSPDIQVVLCCTHHPPFSNSVAPGPSKEVRRRFARPFGLLRKPGLFLSGHVHSYERFEIAGKHFIVSGGGGGHRIRVRSGWDRRIKANVYQGPPVRPLHFCQLEFETGRLILRSVHMEDRDSSLFHIADELAIPVGAAAASLTRPYEPAAPTLTVR